MNKKEFFDTLGNSDSCLLPDNDRGISCMDCPFGPHGQTKHFGECSKLGHSVNGNIPKIIRQLKLKYNKKAMIEEILK
jgi:hypothetical protein